MSHCSCACAAFFQTGSSTVPSIFGAADAVTVGIVNGWLASCAPAGATVRAVAPNTIGATSAKRRRRIFTCLEAAVTQANEFVHAQFRVAMAAHPFDERC